MRWFIAALVGPGVLLMALAAPAAAHNLEVKHPKTGEVVNERWIGGDTVPAEAPPMFGPFNLPPSHGTGLVKSCEATADNEVVSMPAPPFFTGCVHGEP